MMTRTRSMPRDSCWRCRSACRPGAVPQPRRAAPGRPQPGDHPDQHLVRSAGNPRAPRRYRSHLPLYRGQARPRDGGEPLGLAQRTGGRAEQQDHRTELQRHVSGQACGDDGELDACALPARVRPAGRGRAALRARRVRGDRRATRRAGPTSAVPARSMWRCQAALLRRLPRCAAEHHRRRSRLWASAGKNRPRYKAVAPLREFLAAARQPVACSARPASAAQPRRPAGLAQRAAQQRPREHPGRGRPARRQTRHAAVVGAAGGRAPEVRRILDEELAGVWADRRPRRKRSTTR